MSQISMDELRALDSASDSVSAVQSGTWGVDVNSMPADVDIRDLVFATDKVDVSGSNVNAVVTASDLDIRDLAFATDSVTSHQGGTWAVGINDFTIGGNSLVVNADGSLNVAGEVEVDDVSDDILITAKSVTTTSALLLASELTDRRKITLQNLGSNDAYINKTTATVAGGIKIPKFSSASFYFASSISLAAITASGTADFRILEEQQA